MPLYQREELPATTTWIGSLNAQQAIEQCRELGIPASRTLEENRVSLRRFIRERAAPPAEQVQVDSGLPAATVSRAGQQELRDQYSGIAESAWAQINEFIGPVSQPAQVPVQRQPQVSQYQPAEQPDSLAHRPTDRSEVLGTGAGPCSMVIPDQVLWQMRALNTEAIVQATQALASMRPPSDQQEHGVPPFVRDMIRDLPKADGSDPHEIVKFLKGITKILKLKLASDKAILLHATSHTAGTFREFWVENVSTLGSWDDFLWEFKESFLTPETLRTIQNQTLYRNQQRSERLADYVKDMQLAYQILSPETDSDKVFGTIFCRINPETRNSLAGLSQMKSLNDLIQASPIAESIREQFSTVGSRSQENVREHKPHFPRQFNARTYDNSSYNRRYNNSQRNHFTPRHQQYFDNHTREQRQQAPQYVNAPPSPYNAAQAYPYRPSAPFQQELPRGNKPEGQPQLSFPFPPPPIPAYPPPPNQQGGNRNSGNLNYNARR